jgi:hypothetical protein
VGAYAFYPNPWYRRLIMITNVSIASTPAPGLFAEEVTSTQQLTAAKVTQGSSPSSAGLEISIPTEGSQSNSTLSVTHTRITSKLSRSGKAQTYIATVVTRSGKAPTGSVMFKHGPKTLYVGAPLNHGSTSIKVKADRVCGVVTAHYGGDHDHAPSSVEFVPVADNTKADASDSKRATGGPRHAADGHDHFVSGITTGGENEREVALAAEIAELRSSEQLNGLLICRNRTEISSIRLERAAIRLSLGERLDEYKCLLVRTGRDGKWMAFLREANIPKSTAERYVTKWKLSTMPEPINRPTGTIDEPSEEDITAFVNMVKSKANRVLPTPKSVAQFLSKIAAVLLPPTSAA